MVNSVTFYAKIIRIGISYGIDAIASDEPIPGGLFSSLDFPSRNPQEYAYELYGDLTDLLDMDDLWEGDGWYCLIAEIDEDDRLDSHRIEARWALVDIVGFYGDDLSR